MRRNYVIVRYMGELTDWGAAVSYARSLYDARLPLDAIATVTLEEFPRPRWHERSLGNGQPAWLSIHHCMQRVHHGMVTIHAFQAIIPEFEEGAYRFVLVLLWLRAGEAFPQLPGDPQQVEIVVSPVVGEGEDQHYASFMGHLAAFNTADFSGLTLVAAPEIQSGLISHVAHPVDLMAHLLAFMDHVKRHGIEGYRPNIKIIAHHPILQRAIVSEHYWPLPSL